MQKTQKTTVAVAIASVLAVPPVARAVDVAFSGQVNRAITYLGDGEGTGFQFVDNSISGTRFRIRGSQDIGKGLKAGVYGEWQSSNNPSSSVTVKGNNTSNPGFSTRQANVWLSNNWGRITLGQTDGAGNNAAEVDLSNTGGTIAYTNRNSIGGGIAWRTSNGGCITSDGQGIDPNCTGKNSDGGGNLLTHGRTTDDFDGFSRYDVLRYDSPAIGPLTLVGSVGADEQWETSAWLKTGLMGGDLSGAVFYSSGDNARGFNRYGGSASYLFGNGLNVTVSYTKQDFDDGNLDNATNAWVKLGYRWGNNAVSVDYGQTEDLVEGYTDSGVQVAYNYTLPKPKIELYAGVQWDKLDTPGGVGSVQDIWWVTTGSRIKF